MKVAVKGKNKTNERNIDSAFLKADTTWKELVLQEIIPQEKLGIRPEIKIKLEVDTKPPPGFVTEQKLLLKPVSFYVNCFALSDLFAGKMHELLFRKWKNRVKGRDWFDLEWYIKKGIPLHLKHLGLRAQDSGDWKKDGMTRDQLLKLLHEKIDVVSFTSILEDVIRFIPEASVLDIWSPGYFHDLVQQIRVRS
jgi:hypothetical protein